MSDAHRRDALLTPGFVVIVASGLAYFLALAMLNPVIPLYVDRRLGGGGVAVGAAVGAFAVGAVVLRPVAGIIGDRHGRRVLLLAGGSVVALATAGYGAIASLWWLAGMRVVAGVGEAAFFVGAATMITDRAPESRRGEALSYWSVAIYGGLAFGPFLGELVIGPAQRERFARAWVVSAALAALAVVVGFATRDVHDRAGPGARVADETRPPLLHRRAIAPGIVLFAGQIALAGFVGFTELYGRDDLRLGRVGGVFLVYGVVILAVRIFGARLPDRLGARRAGTVALIADAAGMLTIALWRSPTGLYAGAAVFAIGVSLMYPALLVLALDGVPASERGSVVGTFSSFFDLSQGAGGAIAGVVVSVAGYASMYATTAVIAIAGLCYLRSRAAVEAAPYDAPA